MKLVLNEIDFLRVLHISGHMYNLSRSTDFLSGLEERKTRENRSVFFLLSRLSFLSSFITKYSGWTLLSAFTLRTS